MLRCSEWWIKEQARRRRIPFSWIGGSYLFTEDHEAFRELARNFVEKEVVPHYPEWEKGGRMPRDVFKQMGDLGMLGMAIPEEYGGGGTPDYRYYVVLQEEAARAMVTLSSNASGGFPAWRRARC